MRERFLYTLAAAGIGVDFCPPNPGPGITVLDLTFLPGTTEQQIDQAAAIIAAFDWSQAAQAAWGLDRQREQAAQLLYSPDPAMKALRSLILLLVNGPTGQLNILRSQVVGVVNAAWDPSNIANGSGLTSPGVTVTGAAFGDCVDVCAPYSLQGLVATGYVSAANTVNVRLHNSTGGAINLANGTWKVVVRRHTNLPEITIDQARDAMVNVIASGVAD